MATRRPPKPEPCPPHHGHKPPLLCLIAEIQVVLLAIVIGIQLAALLVGLDVRSKIGDVAPFPEYNAMRLTEVIAKIDSLDVRLGEVERKLISVAAVWEHHADASK